MELRPRGFARSEALRRWCWRLLDCETIRGGDGQALTHIGGYDQERDDHAGYAKAQYVPHIVARHGLSQRQSGFSARLLHHDFQNVILGGTPREPTGSSRGVWSSSSTVPMLRWFPCGRLAIRERTTGPPRRDELALPNRWRHALHTSATVAGDRRMADRLPWTVRRRRGKWALVVSINSPTSKPVASSQDAALSSRQSRFLSPIGFDGERG